MIPGSTRISSALEQHDLLKNAITEAGAEVMEIPFVCGGYDSVFIKDNAFLFEAEGRAVALMSRLKHPQRAREQFSRMQSYIEKGFETVQLSSDLHLEGGDLVPAGEDSGIFVGHGFRSSAKAARAITRMTGIPTCALELVNKSLYHLDTALSVLDDGTAIVCKDAVSPASWKKLKQSHWIHRIVEVTTEEAMAFGCNLVQVGNRVIMGSELPRLMHVLERIGYEPKHVPLSEFQRSGGSAACLVAELRKYSSVTLRPGGGNARPALRLFQPVPPGFRS